MRAESQRATQRLLRVLCTSIFVAVAATWACADFESTVDPTGGLPDIEIANPSFAGNIQPIFNLRCAIGGCHTVASRKGSLVLQEGFAYDSIVDVASFLMPQLLLVEPNNPTDSWLVRMIEADDVARNHFARMPLGGQPLTRNQIATIVNWIEQGALDN
ncbi:MAG: hypothetical protein ACT4PJ_02215 [Gemmatimonadaceae bacterium]